MADSSRARRRLAAWSSAVVLLATLLALGLFAGVFVATRVLGTTTMGWDQLADALGGAMAGSVTALVAWGLALRMLSPARRVALAAIAVAGTAGIATALQAVPASTRPGTSADVPPPLIEPFSLQISTADGAAGRSGTGDRLPWQTFRIGSNLAFDYVPADRPAELCLLVLGPEAPDAVASFRALRSILVALPGESACSDPCPSCDEMGLEWYLDHTRFTWQLHDACWQTSDVVRPLRVAVEDIVARYGAGVTCEVTGP
ncbi:MAG: hypothetical protein AB7G23_16870 [Vicinamibacterales bacterium]